MLGLTNEFRKLSNPHQARREKQGTGSQPINRSKNRLANILPCKKLFSLFRFVLKSFQTSYFFDPSVCCKDVSKCHFAGSMFVGFSDQLDWSFACERTVCLKIPV